MLTEEQRERFANLFLRKLLQNLANNDCKNISELKQFIEAMDRIREKELRMQKNNMEKSVHNQWLIEILSRIRYKLADSLDCYEFMKEDLYAEGKINQALGPLFALNKEKVAQAFLMQVELLKSMHKLIMQQIRLVEAANATPIG